MSNRCFGSGGVLLVLTLGVVVGCSASPSAPAGDPTMRTAEPRVHIVEGGPPNVFAKAYVIEGGHGVVVVDALLTRAGGTAIRREVEATGKPLRAVVLTHGHPDHYGGLTTLLDGLPDVSVLSLGGVDRVIRRDDAMKGERLAALGIDWPERRTFPNRLVEPGVPIAFDDFTLTPLDLGPGESDADSVWILRVDGGTSAFIGDLVMEGVHAYTADAHTARWIENLRRCRRELASMATLYPGHGRAGGLDLLDQQERYLVEMRKQVADLAAGRFALSDKETAELQRRMIRFVGHDRGVRWVAESGTPVAKELAERR